MYPECFGEVTRGKPDPSTSLALLTRFASGGVVQCQSLRVSAENPPRIDDGTTVANVNDDQYATDVVRVIYSLADQIHIHEPYSFSRGRLKRTATVHRDERGET